MHDSGESSRNEDTWDSMLNTVVHVPCALSLLVLAEGPALRDIKVLRKEPHIPRIKINRKL